MIKAKGQLRHRFWGTYSAAVALAFDSIEEAARAVPVLNEGTPPDAPHWTIASDHRAAFIIVDSDELDALKTRLAGFGADPNAIDSLAHSVDFGDPFTIEIYTLANA